MKYNIYCTGILDYNALIYVLYYIYFKMLSRTRFCEDAYYVWNKTVSQFTADSNMKRNVTAY
jgi:hypothetical protein